MNCSCWAQCEHVHGSSVEAITDNETPKRSKHNSHLRHMIRHKISSKISVFTHKFLVQHGHVTCVWHPIAGWPSRTIRKSIRKQREPPMPTTLGTWNCHLHSAKCNGLKKTACSSSMSNSEEGLRRFLMVEPAKWQLSGFVSRGYPPFWWWGKTDRLQDLGVPIFDTKPEKNRTSQGNFSNVESMEIQQNPTGDGTCICRNGLFWGRNLGLKTIDFTINRDWQCD